MILGSREFPIWPVRDPDLVGQFAANEENRMSRNSPLKELEGLRMGLHNGVTHLPRTHVEIVEAASLVTGFKFSKHGLARMLSGSDEKEKDAGYFVSVV